MAKPVIFLAFANDPNAPLASLQREKEAIQQAFEPLVKADRVELIVLEGATLPKIFAEFSRYRDRIVIFHYAGHGASDKIFLEDGAANASGFAKLLGEQKKLQLVFLNACATQRQVIELLRLNTPAVIATSEPVHDEKAGDFATQFYQSLVSMATLQGSFNEALALLESKNQLGIGAVKINRFLGALEAAEHSITEQPWGIYIRDEAALLWSLRKVIPQNYRLANIRRFLRQGLNDSDFDFMCMDHFPEVQNQFGDGMSRDRKVLLLLDHCKRFEAFDRLISAMQEMNEAMFEKHQPYF